MAPSVSVIVPVRNGATGLPHAVESALAQEPADLEVVIAVGPSTDGTESLAADLARHDRVRLVSNPSGGTAAGLNAALAVSTGDVIVRCDAHAVLPPGYVATAVSVLEETGAANVGGMQVAVGETAFERAVALAVTSPFGAGDARYRVGGEAGPVDTVYLGVFRRSALDRVGGFDERLVRTQDAELNLRLTAAGEVVWFDPRLRVRYRPRGSVRALARQYFGYGRWRRAVGRLHPGTVRLRQAIPPLLLVGLVASVPTAFVSPVLALAVPTAYGVILLAATTWGLIRRHTSAALLLPIVLPIIHLSWAAGYLSSIKRL